MRNKNTDKYTAIYDYSGACVNSVYQVVFLSGLESRLLGLVLVVCACVKFLLYLWLAKIFNKSIIEICTQKMHRVSTQKMHIESCFTRA